MSYPTLYKKTKTGAIQQWEVHVEDNYHYSEIVVTQGQVGGEKQAYHTPINEGKNIGKSNETTHYDQAEAEAQSKWNKQVKKGYTEDPSGEILVELPMKVQTFQGKENNVVYPASGLPKLDGVNGTWKRDADRVLTLWTRGGDQYPVIEHMVDEIHSAMDDFGVNKLAGEVYCHGMHLQDITAGTKKFNKKYTPQLQFHLFDIPETGLVWKDRGMKGICRLAGEYFQKNKYVFITPCVTLKDEAEAWEYHKFCVDNGFEGIIIVNWDNMYEYNTRSSTIFKLKVQLDKEYKCIGYKVDKLGHPVLECITSEGETFWPKPEGDDARRKGILKHIDQWVGSWIKIRYEKLSKAGKPTKPVAECIRLCDDNGEPLE